MSIFNKIYKFGSTIKPKASLYCLGIIFFIGFSNLCFSISTIDILTLVQCFLISLLIAVIEYIYFDNYDELSPKKKKRNTINWAILTNIFIISSSVLFKWFPPLPLWATIVLLIALQLAIVAMRYSIYIVNLSDTTDLNNKLKKYQDNNK